MLLSARPKMPIRLAVLRPREPHEPDARQSPDDDARKLLLGCHDRIRNFSQVAMRLANDPASASDRSETASAVGRYFESGMPLHVEDEERSLAPRLGPLLISDEERAALARMSCEHQEIEALLNALLPMWRVLAASPERWEALAPLLAAQSEALATLLFAHVEAEESDLLPAIDRLPPEERAAIATEIRARRALHVPGR